MELLLNQEHNSENKIHIRRLNCLDELPFFLEKVNQEDRIFLLNSIGINGKIMGFNIFLLDEICQDHIHAYNFLFDLTIEYSFKDFMNDILERNTLIKELKIIRLNIKQILEDTIKKNLEDINDDINRIEKLILI